MKTKDIKKGISLIVLIITIIVVIILAAVVILTLSKNNPIESAKEARFKEDVRTFQDELALYISKQYTNAGGHWDGNISATTYGEIKNYIPSFTKKYEGKFIINNNNLEYTNKLDEKEKEYAQSLNFKKYSILPSEYQQVEYIKSTGTQYIDTNIVGKSSITANIDFEVVSSTQWACIIGCLNSSETIGFVNGATAWSSITGGWIRRNNNNLNFSGNNIMNYKIKTNVQCLQKSVVYTNNNGTFTYNCDGGNSYDSNTTLYMFANHTSPVRDYAKLKIYVCKIYDNNLLVRNFIPCYSTTKVTNADGDECDVGTVGLYDTVEGKFYTNQGTGEFIAGPDVNE